MERINDAHISLIMVLLNVVNVTLLNATLFVPSNATRLSRLFSSFLTTRDLRRMVGRNGIVF
jgi:hypothetical protein